MLILFLQVLLIQLFSSARSANTHNVITINNSTIDSDSILRGRIFSSVMSSGSMAGSLLIIVSYLLFKDIRTKARLVLFHLSLADFGVGSSNFIGAIVHYGGLINQTCPHPGSANKSANQSLSLCIAYIDLCKVQAFFASFFTIASISWTLLLSLYVYILVVDSGRKLSEYIIKFGYAVCWCIPLLVSVWLVSTHKLGSTRHGGGGWCSLRVEDRGGHVNFIAVLFGSDIWVVSTFIVILILYSSTHIYLKQKIYEMKKLYAISSQMFSDYKFLAIPFMFLLLRLGSLLFSILYVYTNTWNDMSNVWRKIIYYWMAIGDSSEGIVNGIIFCLLTPKVRQKLCPCSCYKKKDRSTVPLPPTETEEQKKLLEKADVSYGYSTNHTVSSLSSSVSGD